SFFPSAFCSIDSDLPESDYSMANRQLLGILGGMGPLASAEFVKTIYERSLNEPEQAAPAVVMRSDPSFPDRTQSLIAREYEPLLSMLIEALYCLRDQGASRIVICCVTIHYLLPMLPAELRRRIISLLDVIFDLVAENRKKHLLMSTLGARKLRIFERHARWRALKGRIIMPDEKDQSFIHHSIIYQIKRSRGVGELVP